jgi:TolA-binding protein
MTKKNQSLNVDDALTQSEAFVIKYKTKILIVIAAVIIIVGGILLTNTFILKPRAEKASAQIALGYKYILTGDYKTAINGNGKDFVGYAKIVDDYSFTSGGNLANFYLGICYAKSGKTKDAIKSLENYKDKGDKFISPAALMTLANCYATDGQVDKAIETFKKAASEAENNSISPEALIQAGLLLENQNKKDEALKLYQEVKEKYVTSIQSQSIDAYIERVSK